ncbi:hypothetical protein I4U23_020569 [Adineta vaga]|nr:hypothetical protein I4U23_020569 [Adineta vaga]
MFPFTILIHNTNALSSSSSSNDISLTSFLERSFQSPIQSSFNRHARIPSLVSNIFLWLVFLITIIVLQIGKQELSATVKMIYGCTEQLLLKKRIQIDMIKRELGFIQKHPQLLNYLTVTATNYYNTLRRKYVDYQLYDKSSWLRIQSCLYRDIRLIETPFHTRQYHINIPDFIINENHLCQIFFAFELSIIGRDARIVHDDIQQEFQRLETKLLNSNNEQDTDVSSMNKFARIQRQIYFQFNDPKQQDLLCGQRRTCLTYENKSKIYYQWFLTENSFWIMTCVGLSWLFRAIFACLITKITVPIHIELEGAMPLQSSIVNYEEKSNKGKVSNKT